MTISAETMPDIRQQYAEIIGGSLQRAAELDAPGVVIEFETLPPMCENPAWGIELAQILMEGMEKAHATPRPAERAPHDAERSSRNDPPASHAQRTPSGEHLADLRRGRRSGSRAAQHRVRRWQGAERRIFLECDLGGVLFALTVLGVRDMRFLWTEIVRIAGRFNAIPAGDTACGFANTAMVLAEKKYIPRVFAAVVRAVSAVRSLVAYECGAVGPGKDCGYENPFLKAITGYPMAMEGKTSACAHLSPVGNVAAATCDTWSNESVQNFKLLGGMAPSFRWSS